MQRLKRWAPLVGVAVLSAGVILRAFGLGDAAAVVEQIGGLTGLSAQSPVGTTELAAAIAGAIGLVLKVRNIVREARTIDDRVSLPKG